MGRHVNDSAKGRNWEELLHPPCPPYNGARRMFRLTIGRASWCVAQFYVSCWGEAEHLCPEPTTVWVEAHSIAWAVARKIFWGRPCIVPVKYYNVCASPASPGCVFGECLAKFPGRQTFDKNDVKNRLPSRRNSNSGESVFFNVLVFWCLSLVSERLQEALKTVYHRFFWVLQLVSSSSKGSQRAETSVNLSTTLQCLNCFAVESCFLIFSWTSLHEVLRQFQNAGTCLSSHALNDSSVQVLRLCALNLKHTHKH